MKEQVLLAKLVMALHRQNINVSDQDALAYFKYNKCSIEMEDEDGETVTLISDAEVKGLMSSLNIGKKLVGPHVGSTVGVTYNNEPVTGKIKKIYYQVEGAGNKYFTEKDFK